MIRAIEYAPASLLRAAAPATAVGGAERRLVGYRAYVLGRSGHILIRHKFRSANDKAALKHARRYLEKHDVEVWQRDRLVALLEHTDKAA